MKTKLGTSPCKADRNMLELASQSSDQPWIKQVNSCGLPFRAKCAGDTRGMFASVCNCLMHSDADPRFLFQVEAHFVMWPGTFEGIGLPRPNQCSGCSVFNVKEAAFRITCPVFSCICKANLGAAQSN